MSDFHSQEFFKEGAKGWLIPAGLPLRDVIVGVDEIGAVRLATFDWSEHSSPYGHIMVPLGEAHGRVTWRLRSEEQPSAVEVTSRHVCFIEPNISHSWKWDSHGKLMFFFIRPAFIQHVLREKMWRGVVLGEFAAAVGRDRCLLLLTDLCADLWGTSEPSERKLVEGLANSIVHRLLRVNFIETSSSAGTTLTPNQLHAVTDFMHKRLEKMPRVDEMARVVGLSDLHFIRVFKNTTGVPPKRFFIALVMQKSAEMLRSGNYRVEEVAYHFGYEDPGYFGRYFRRVFKRSPSQYLHEHRRKTS